MDKYSGDTERKSEKDMMISIGIPTLGEPQLIETSRGWRLKNMLIGKNFHWQRSIEALLPGSVEVSGLSDFQVINRLPLEKYLECVVGSEMNPGAPAEFMKAHAIISRCWASGKVLAAHSNSSAGKVISDSTVIDWEDTADHHGFDLCSDDHCQRYQGIQPLDDKILRAIRETAGEILVSREGKLIDTRFSKCCGGRTEIFSTCWQDKEEPALVSFEDKWCNLSVLSAEDRNRVLSSILKSYDLENEGGFSWKEVVSSVLIRRRLKSVLNRDIGNIEDIRIVSRGESGRIKLLKLIGSDRELTIGKELLIRKIMSESHLYSSWFDIEEMEAGSNKSGNYRSWRLNGRGWGHGVGLCQIGAARMAIAGHSYRDILSFYYPGAEIKKIDWNIRPNII